MGKVDSWVDFVHVGPSKSGKTQIWAVVNGDVELGDVMWYGPWRKYCFFPERDTIFEESCLRDIAAFVHSATRDHREAKKRD